MDGGWVTRDYVWLGTLLIVSLWQLLRQLTMRGSEMQWLNEKVALTCGKNAMLKQIKERDGQTKPLIKRYRFWEEWNHSHSTHAWYKEALNITFSHTLCILDSRINNISQKDSTYQKHACMWHTNCMEYHHACMHAQQYRLSMIMEVATINTACTCTIAYVRVAKYNICMVTSTPWLLTSPKQLLTATHPSTSVSLSKLALASRSPIRCTCPLWKQSLEWFIILLLEVPSAPMYSTTGTSFWELCTKWELLDTLSRYFLPKASNLK